MNYYSYRYDETMKLDSHEYGYLFESMKKAKSRDRLKMLEIYSFPHIADDKRDKLLKRLNMEAEAKEMMAKRAVSSDDLKGFGVSIEDVVRAKNGK